MKESCDNHCETCPMQTQLHCVLVFSKATNTSVGALAERIQKLEETMKAEQPTIINPLSGEQFGISEQLNEYSAKLPAQETGV